MWIIEWNSPDEILSWILLLFERSDSIIRSSNGYREYVNSQSNLEPFDVEDVYDDDVSDILSDFDITDAFEETDNFFYTSNVNNNNILFKYLYSFMI